MEFLSDYGVYIILFLGGFVGGMFFERYILKKEKLTHHFPRVIVSSTIFGLWAISMWIDIMNQTQNTPLVLHAFSGAVVGAMNHEIGDYFLKIFKK